MPSDSTRGGRRPGAGRKPGNGTGPNPEIRERVPADLADYCKTQQATSPGFLARLIRQHRSKQMIQIEGVNCSVFEANGTFEVYPQDWTHPIADCATEEQALQAAAAYIKENHDQF